MCVNISYPNAFCNPFFCLEFTHFHAGVVCAVPCASLLAAVWSAFALPPQRAHRFAPTVLPLAQSVPARPSAPLDNRKIAFGCVRLAPPPLCAKAARLSGAMRRAVGTGALAALGRLATPPPRIPLSPWMRNPSANAPCMAWSGYLPAPCNAASRRLAHPGAESALAPWSAPPIPPARGTLRSLRFARALDCSAICAAFLRKLRFLRRIIRKMSAQALPLAPLDLRHAMRFALHWHIRSATRPTRPTRLTHGAPSMSLLGAERGVEAAARGGASADGGMRKAPRMRLRGATGGIPTKRLAAQARLDCAPYGGCARGSRRCAAAAPPEAQR